MTQKPDTTLIRDHEWFSKAEVLTEALPFMRRYSGPRSAKCSGS